MNMKKFLFLLLSVCVLNVYAEQSEELAKKPKEEKAKKEKSEVRKGWTFGILPSVAYDADKGFQYGVLANIYDFGDGSVYPEYFHSLYVEAAYTTKRSGLFRFNYDSKFLIPDHRLKLDLSYLPDALCDFYGYNGYQSVFNADWDNKKSENCISRAFYKSKRDLLRFAADIDGKIGGNWYWNAGVGMLGDFERLSIKESLETINLNCVVPTRLMHMIIPYMNKGSHLINMSSGAAFICQPGFAVYAASKAYILSLGDALSKELRHRNIYVTTVCPGAVNTPFITKSQKYAKIRWFKKLIMANERCVVHLALWDSKKKKTRSIYGIYMLLFSVVCKVIPLKILMKFM